MFAQAEPRPTTTTTIPIRHSGNRIPRSHPFRSSLLAPKNWFPISPGAAFWHTFRFCDDLRKSLAHIIGRRYRSLEDETTRHLEYLRVSLAQLYHDAKDLASIVLDDALKELPAELSGRIHERVSHSRRHFVHEINYCLDEQASAQTFDVSESLVSILSRLQASFSVSASRFPEISLEQLASPVFFGNRSVFERACHTLLLQVIGFLMETESSRRRKLRVIVVGTRRPDIYAVCVAHNGQPLTLELASRLFWFRTPASGHRSGIALALSGMAFRSLGMYPTASVDPPVDIGKAAGSRARFGTWFTVFFRGEV